MTDWVCIFYFFFIFYKPRRLTWGRLYINKKNKKKKKKTPKKMQKQKKIKRELIMIKKINKNQNRIKTQKNKK
ncbi:hypothetical protein ACO2WH_26075, partial [Escherichia coli]|uniref:hypothetical protein n=1 Tax=Escherichia coli TaxID=562 RepID=UPI003C099890